MKLSLAAWIYLSTLVSAHNFWSRETNDLDQGAEGLWSPGSIGPNTTPQDTQTFISAGRQPNQTSSASFNFAPGNLSDSDSSTWIWRVNISEPALPDSQEIYVVNSEWDLQWPGAGTLHSFVDRADLNGSNGGGLCMHVAEINLPSNITSRYAESDQGNCSTVLGAACLEALMNAPSSGGCAEPANLLSGDLPECMDTLALAQSGSTSNPGI